MTHSILVMMYGQSNADAHNAGPCNLSPYLDNPNVVVPNDGRGFQGLRGGARLKPITGFESAYNPKNLIQSICGPIGCSLLENAGDQTLSRVIVRSAARGGRPLHGYRRDDREVEGIALGADGQRSPLVDIFIEDVAQIAAMARLDGAPVKHVYIPFFHGEADRSMARDDYQAALTALMDEIDAELAAMGLNTTWLLTQASGTGEGFNGNGWGNRLCLTDIASGRANAHLVAANYAYALDDNVHLSADSKVLLGEYLGHQIARLEQGRSVAMTELADVVVDGSTVDLFFKGPNGLVLDTSQFPAPDALMGFHIDRQKDQSILKVEQTAARAVRLSCAQPLDGARTTIDYAFRGVKADRDATDIAPYAIGRGCLREDWARPSRVFEGRNLYRWVPGFSVALADVRDVAAVA